MWDAWSFVWIRWWEEEQEEKKEEISGKKWAGMQRGPFFSVYLSINFLSIFGLMNKRGKRY